MNRKTRAKLFMSDALTSQLDKSEKDERDSVYQPVVREENSFFDMAGAALEKEEIENGEEIRKPNSSGWLTICLSVAASVAIFVVILIVLLSLV